MVIESEILGHGNQSEISGHGNRTRKLGHGDRITRTGAGSSNEKKWSMIIEQDKTGHGHRIRKTGHSHQIKGVCASLRIIIIRTWSSNQKTRKYYSIPLLIQYTLTMAHYDTGSSSTFKGTVAQDGLFTLFQLGHLGSKIFLVWFNYLPRYCQF